MFFKQLNQSIGHALDGIVNLIKQERNAKIHLVTTALVIYVGFNMEFTAQEWIWISLAVACVWVAELINTSIERLTNLVSPEHHPLAKQVKDYAAGAVLVMSLWAIVVFCLIAFPHLVMWLTFSN
ncbi:diacylglycerol kinase family protein [Aquirufa echingensis]|uniref:Diacylglycerol kinase family protein n=1 Tax=Aquirufa echingensis TaxID=3096516 RepID=A0ABW6CW47_9BACT